MPTHSARIQELDKDIFLVSHLEWFSMILDCYQTSLDKKLQSVNTQAWIRFLYNIRILWESADQSFISHWGVLRTQNHIHVSIIRFKITCQPMFGFQVYCCNFWTSQCTILQIYNKLQTNPVTTNFKIPKAARYIRLFTISEPLRKTLEFRKYITH